MSQEPLPKAVSRDIFLSLDVDSYYLFNKGNSIEYLWQANYTVIGPSQKVLLCPTPRPHGLQHVRLLCSPVSQSFLKFMSIVSVTLSNHLVPCCPFSFCLQFFPVSGSFPMSPNIILPLKKVFHLRKKKALLYLVFCIQHGKKDCFQIKPKTTLTQTVIVNKFMKKNFKFTHNHRTAGWNSSTSWWFSWGRQNPHPCNVRAHTAVGRLNRHFLTGKFYLEDIFLPAPLLLNHLINVHYDREPDT